jgi:hypothetical protein
MATRSAAALAASLTTKRGRFKFKFNHCFVRRTPHRCPAFTDNVKQIHYTLEMHWRKSFILNFRSTANDNAITEHTDTALCKKLKTTHPHDIVELNNYEKASVDDKNLMCLVTFSQDTNSKQDEISE